MAWGKGHAGCDWNLTVSLLSLPNITHIPFHSSFQLWSLQGKDSINSPTSSRNMAYKWGVETAANFPDQWQFEIQTYG